MQSNAQDPQPSEPSDPAQPTRFLQSLTDWDPYNHPLPSDLDDAALACVAGFLREEMRPATNAEVVSAVKRLRSHYSEWSQLTETEEADIWRDWLLDFKAYPKSLLERACATWRNSTAKKAPSPGQLKDKVRAERERLSWLSDRLGRARVAARNPDRRWR